MLNQLTAKVASVNKERWFVDPYQQWTVVLVSADGYVVEVVTQDPFLAETVKRLRADEHYVFFVNGTILESVQ